MMICPPQYHHQEAFEFESELLSVFFESKRSLKIFFIVVSVNLLVSCCNILLKSLWPRPLSTFSFLWWKSTVLHQCISSLSNLSVFKIMIENRALFFSYYMMEVYKIIDLIRCKNTSKISLKVFQHLP